MPTLRAYREHAQVLGEEAIHKANQQLDNGTPPKEVIETLTRNLINKLTHDPSVNLRSAVASGNTGLLDAVRTLFHIKDKK